MDRTRVTAAASRFAHLIGLGAGAPPARVEEPPPATPPARVEEPGQGDGDAPRRLGEGDDEEEEEEAAAAAAAAAGPAFDARSVRHGRHLERERCGAIFASPMATRNIGLAASLAFETRLPAQQAIAILERTPAAGRLAERMAAAPRVDAGAPAAAATGSGAIQASWARAFAPYAPKPRGA